MKKKYYGNYLGIVITGAHSDPENRGRCQIFIPHISNTLYKKWNKLNKDISFSHIDPSVFTPDILQDLKLSLPWAECAAPIFGGGTSAFYNPLTQSVGVNLEDSSLAEDSTKPDKSSGDFPSTTPANHSSDMEAYFVDDPELSQNFTPISSDNTGNNKLAEDRQKYFFNELSKDPSLVNFLYERAVNEVGSNPKDQQTWVETIANRAMFGGMSLEKVVQKQFIPIENGGYYPTSSFKKVGSPTKGFQDAFNEVFVKGSNITNLATDNASNQAGNPVANRRIAAGVTGNWFKNGQIVAPGTKGAEFLYRSDASKTYRTTAGIKASEYAKNNNIEISPPNLNDPHPNPDPTNYSYNSNFNPASNGYGSANGFFSFPREGAKLWVFFLGGDIQKPVYFAMQHEPISVRQFQQSNSPGKESIPNNPNDPYFSLKSNNPLNPLGLNNIGLIDPHTVNSQRIVSGNVSLDMTNSESIGGSKVSHNSSIFSLRSGAESITGGDGNISLSNPNSRIDLSEHTSISNDGGRVIISGDVVHLHAESEFIRTTGDHTKNAEKYLQEEQKVVNDIAKQQESAIKGGSEDVTCPICEQKLADDKSDFIARILRTLQKISNLLPWDCWNWGVTQFLINFIAIPMLSEVSVLFMSGGEGCGMCKSGKVKSYQKGIEKANQEGAKNFAEKSKQLSEKAKGVKIGSNVQSTIGSCGINAGGSNINNAPCAVKVKDDTSLYPTKLKKSDKTSANVLYPAGEKTETVVYIMPNKTSAGDITLQSANDIKMLAGSPGIQMETQGKTSIKSGFVEILAGDGPAVLSSNNVTSVTSSTGKVVIEGKQGVSIGSNTYVQGNLGISGNLGVKGSLTLDGLVATKHLICKSMRSTTTSGSSPKACSNSATWFTEGATAVDIFDKTKNLILRDLSPKMYLLTPKGLVTFFQEILDSVLLNIGMEPTVTGIGFGFGVVTVFNFTHTHQLVSQDHSHDIDMPQWQRAGDNKAWANMAPDPSAEAPIPAPSQGDDPQGGPKAPTSCGGGGFGFGGGSNSSRRRANRNARFGVPTGSTDYSRITPQGYFNDVTFRTVSTNLTGISGDKITVVTDLSGNQITIYTDISGNEFTLNDGTLTGTRVYIEPNYTPNNQKWTYDPNGNIYPRDIVRFTISEDCI
jgi:hypothetical protein